MKKYISGKVYDTETAHMVGEWDNGQVGSFGWCEEKLYHKRTGEYFLHGSGGAATTYRKTCGLNEWCGCEQILPMTVAQAREWAEYKLDAAAYDAEFGAPAEDADSVVLSLSVPAAVADKARKAAAEAGVSLSAYIAGLISGQK